VSIGYVYSSIPNNLVSLFPDTARVLLGRPVVVVANMRGQLYMLSKGDQKKTLTFKGMYEEKNHTVTSVQGLGLGLGLYMPGTTLSPEVGAASLASYCMSPCGSLFQCTGPQNSRVIVTDTIETDGLSVREKRERVLVGPELTMDPAAADAARREKALADYKVPLTATQTPRLSIHRTRL
jgi:hypothetical protein